MSSSPQPGGSGSEAAPATAGRRQPIVLELSLAPGEPVRGTVGRPGRAPTPFQGWIDLMSAINSLRGAAGPAG